MTSDTDDLIWELQDQVQRLGRKVDLLLLHSGIDPGKAGEGQGEAAGAGGERAA